MSAGVIVAIVVGAVLVLGMLALFGVVGSRRMRNRRRARAQSLRAEAQAHTLEAERMRALAQEQAARAEREIEVAREHHDRATQIDPDLDSAEQEARTIDESDGGNGRAADGRGARATQGTRS